LRLLLALLGITLLWIGLSPVLSPQTAGKKVLHPDPDIGVESLPARKKAQIESVSQFKVFYQFQFTDKLKESGITFVHRIVNDAGKTYKPVHYDHGSGIAVADVDTTSTS